METVPELCPEGQNKDRSSKERMDDYCIEQIRFNKTPSCKFLEITDLILVLLIKFIL